MPLPPSFRSRHGEKPGFTLWAGPTALVINADLPGIDLEALRVDVAGARLIFSGPLRPEPPGRKNGRRQAGGRAGSFSHTIELPYRVDADRAEVRKENGLISIVLKKKESEPGNGNGRLESSILNSVKRYFGGNGSSPKNRDEDTLILKALDRYFDFIGMKSDAPQRRQA
jgi:HSP20 family molecular chaperone IbpA